MQLRNMDYPFINQRMFSALYLGISSLSSSMWLKLIKELSDEEPFSFLKLKQFSDLVETALDPSPERITKDIDPDLRKFFVKIYSSPDMTDLVWLNMFRILSTRVGRLQPFVPVYTYLPVDYNLIRDITVQYSLIANKHGIRNEFGFITPIDNGKRCMYEYDYFFDHNNPDEVARVKRASTEANQLVDDYSALTGTVKGHHYVLHQGFSRKENLLYS